MKIKLALAAIACVTLAACQPQGSEEKTKQAPTETHQQDGTEGASMPEQQTERERIGQLADSSTSTDMTNQGEGTATDLPVDQTTHGEETAQPVAPMQNNEAGTTGEIIDHSTTTQPSDVESHQEPLQ